MLADVAVGPVIAVISLSVGLAVLLAVTLIEWVTLLLFRWGRVGRTLRDVLLVNVATTLVGFGLFVLANPSSTQVGYDPQRGGRIYETTPALLPGEVAFGVAFGLSWLIELGLMTWLSGRGVREIWLPLLVANLLSYAFLAILLFGGVFS